VLTVIGSDSLQTVKQSGHAGRERGLLKKNSDLVAGGRDAARRAHIYISVAQSPTSAGKDHMQTIDQVL
jgi:hypothetical protein